MPRFVLTVDVLDRSLVDTWIKTGDQESFTMSRRLIRTEGLLCGGSSGAAVVGAVKIAKQLNLGKDKTVVVVLPDSLRNYITKVTCLPFFADDSSSTTLGCKNIISLINPPTLDPKLVKLRRGKKQRFEICTSLLWYQSLKPLPAEKQSPKCKRDDSINFLLSTKKEPFAV